MKIFVITANCLLDEKENTGEAFFDENKAIKIVAERNSEFGHYGIKYGYEEVEVK